MKKQILQIENTQSSDFIPQIVLELKKALDDDNKNNIDSEKLLTREETAEMLSISLVTLWKYSKDNIIPAYRIGTKVRYKKSEILLALKKMNQFK
ncbi:MULTISPECIES: helix-turn-helix domain-containing protein [unclassified Cellulophaga]|uniref:helix-turn-helix domain-containing protein n=1 Tax=unclassified Cellulophaga TaxID=2634405 RepID=UPI0026E302A3|nr:MULTISPECIES: helix-turn-helix domain-containing protein [unclassified Cellulophaga]MDO6490177.1 helix-turn-helix domain-containing protein [Cellulophaga sp. 2_MG-2023]MDO6494629.1 helix-turn-helix domain-containing protein [Cellulophaga sp. 3_MG-2023]